MSSRSPIRKCSSHLVEAKDISRTEVAGRETRMAESTISKVLKNKRSLGPNPHRQTDECFNVSPAFHFPNDPWPAASWEHHG